MLKVVKYHPCHAFDAEESELSVATMLKGYYGRIKPDENVFAVGIHADANKREPNSIQSKSRKRAFSLVSWIPKFSCCQLSATLTLWPQYGSRSR